MYLSAMESNSVATRVTLVKKFQFKPQQGFLQEAELRADPVLNGLWYSIFIDSCGFFSSWEEIDFLPSEKSIFLGLWSTKIEKTMEKFLIFDQKYGKKLCLELYKKDSPVPLILLLPVDRICVLDVVVVFVVVSVETKRVKLIFSWKCARGFFYFTENLKKCLFTFKGLDRRVFLKAALVYSPLWGSKRLPAKEWREQLQFWNERE